jgi:hypothetical protein
MAWQQQRYDAILQAARALSHTERLKGPPLLAGSKPT